MLLLDMAGLVYESLEDPADGLRGERRGRFLREAFHHEALALGIVDRQAVLALVVAHAQDQVDPARQQLEDAPVDLVNLAAQRLQVRWGAHATMLAAPRQTRTVFRSPAPSLADRPELSAYSMNVAQPHCSWT